MALLFFEGFENKEPTGRAGLSYGTGAANIGFVAGRSSGSAVRVTGAVANSFLRISWASSASGKFVVSAAVRVDALTTVIDLIKLSAPTGGNDHCTLSVLTTGAIRLTPSGGTAVTSTYAMVVGEWARVDLVCNVAESPSGWAEAWVNGVKVCEVLNTDTRNNNESGLIGSATMVLGPTNGGRCTVDDVYVTDDTGPAPYNGRIGDIRVETIVPGGNGSSSQLMGSDGNTADNFALVDEMPASSTDYVTGAAGEKDLYAMTDLSVPAGTVHAVQAHYVSAKSDAGAATLIPVTKLGATEVDGAPLGLGLAPVYAVAPISLTAPDGTPWTVAKVNSAEFGVKVG